MTPELEHLKTVGFTVCESRLMGLSKKRRKDGDWYELVIQVLPEEMPNNLFVVPLGTRMGVAMVQIADDETPQKPKREFKDMPLSQQAGIMTRKPDFQNWCARQDFFPGDALLSGIDIQGCAISWVKGQCGIESFTDLDRVEVAADTWQALLERYTTDTRLPEQRG